MLSFFDLRAMARSCVAEPAVMSGIAIQKQLIFSNVFLTGMENLEMKFSIRDIEGNVLEEDNIVIGEDDTLVMCSNDIRAFRALMTLPKEEFKKVVGGYKKILEEGGGTILLPPGFSFKVIRREP